MNAGLQVAFCVGHFQELKVCRATAWLLMASIIFLTYGCQRPGGDSPQQTTQTLDKNVSNMLTELLQTISTSSLDQAVRESVQAQGEHVQADLQSARAWGQLGMTLLAHDQSIAAAECLRVAGDLDHLEGKWPYLRGMALRTRDAQSAINCFEAAAERYGSRSIRPLIRQSELLSEMERYDEALLRVNAALRIDSDHAEAILLRAQIELLRNQPADCLATLERLLSQPTAPKSAYLLASEAARRLRNGEVSQKWQELATNATDWEPSDPILQEALQLRVGLKAGLKRADELYSQQKVKESVDELERLVLRYPDSEWVHVLLGRAYLRTRDLERAEVSLKKALALNPGSFEAHFRMAVLFQVKDQPQLAAEWFQKTLAIKPYHAVSYRNLADAQVLLGDFDGAEKSLMRCVQVQPNYLDGYVSLIAFYVKRGRPAEAREWLSRAERLGTSDERLRRLRNSLPQDFPG